MTQTVGVTARGQLAAFQTRIEQHGYATTLKNDGELLTVIGPGPALEITCAPWVCDGERLHIWLAGTPLVEVSTGAMVADAALLLHRQLNPGSSGE